MRFSFKKFFSFQTGRSMIEMLAVLAIVGVLGLVSYGVIRTGLAKTQANKISYTVNLEAQALMFKDSIEPLPEGELDVSNKETENHFPISAQLEVLNSISTLKIIVSNVPKDICEQAKRLLPIGSFYVSVNGEEISAIESFSGSCEEGQANSLTWYFDPDNTKSQQAKNDYLCADVICGDCKVCQNGECLNKEEGSSCPDGFCTSTQNCVECITNEQCLSRTDTKTACINNVCSCPDTSSWDNNLETCSCETGKTLSNNHCCPNNTPFYNQETNSCEILPCVSNSDCLKNQYCFVTEVDTSTCSVTTGKCIVLSVSNTSLEGWTTSSSWMNWHSSMNFCDAQEKQLTTKEEFAGTNLASDNYWTSNESSNCTVYAKKQNSNAGYISKTNSLKPFCTGKTNICTSNDGCETDQFCLIMAIDTSTCTPTAGKCIKLKINPTSLEGWTTSFAWMNWLSSVNFCNAQEKQLATREALSGKGLASDNYWTANETSNCKAYAKIQNSSAGFSLKTKELKPFCHPLAE